MYWIQLRSMGFRSTLFSLLQLPPLLPPRTTSTSLALVFAASYQINTKAKGKQRPKGKGVVEDSRHRGLLPILVICYVVQQKWGRDLPSAHIILTVKWTLHTSLFWGKIRPIILLCILFLFTDTNNDSPLLGGSNFGFPASTRLLPGQ